MLFRTILAALSLLRFTPVLPAEYPLTPSAAADSTNTKDRWVLVELYGEAVEIPQDAQEEIYLVIDKSTMRYEGFAGCNNILGAFETAGAGDFHFTSISTARCSCNCPNEVSALLEGIIAETMARVDRYEQSSERMTFFVGDVPVLVFELHNDNYRFVSDVHRL